MITCNDLQSPALCIEQTHVEANLRAVVAALEGQIRRWRPHVKTTKIPEILDKVLETGVTRFKCATSREAECLLQRAFRPVDLLVAMSHRGANLIRITQLAERFPQHQISLLCEDPDHAGEVRRVGNRLGLYLDLNPGFHRTGIPLNELERITATVEAATPVLRGLHFYDGHIRDRDPQVREERAHRLYSDFLKRAHQIQNHSPEPLELCTSGTPTFLCALSYRAFQDWDHTVSPGTVVYWDTTSEDFQIPGFQFAATVMTRVLSRPAADRVTCDAGSKAVDAACGDPCAQVREYPNLVALTPSEEHLPLQVLEGKRPRSGDLLHLIPKHVCPTVNLADYAILLRDGRIDKVVPVSARGHECELLNA